jgi:flagellar assembly protein FliH
MSPRAIRANASAAARFAWPAPDAPIWDEAAAQPLSAFLPQLDAAPAPAPPPPRTAFDPKEHEARLAALEREAFTKGYAQGEQAGLEAGNRRSDAMLRRLGETLDEMASLRRTLLQQSERQVVQLALALARRIVRREVAVDEELTVALARVALDRLGESGPATIRLHPDDFARAASRGADTWKRAHISVVADPSVSRGGCMVESPFGFVDAGIDAQFQELARALLDDGIGHDLTGA